MMLKKLMIIFVMLLIILMISSATVQAIDTNVESGEEYVFTGEEIIQLANIIEELKLENENLKEQINLYEKEVELKAEKLNSLKDKVRLYEEKEEELKNRIDLVVKHSDKIIELQGESISNLEDSVDYHKKASNISLLDRVQWVLIGAGVYAILK